MLVLGYAGVQTEELVRSVTLLRELLKTVHAAQTVAQQEEAKGFRWASEQSTEVEESLGTWSSCEVNECKWNPGWLVHDSVWSFQEISVALSPSGVVVACLFSVEVGIRVELLGGGVELQDLVDIAFDALDHLLNCLLLLGH